MAQTIWPSVAVLVAGPDDAPTERTLAALGRQTIGADCFRVIRLDHDVMGVNRAVAALTEPYCLLLRAGDVPAPALLEMALWALETRPYAGAVRVCCNDWVDHEPEAGIADLLGNDPIPSRSLVRTRDWLRAGGYRPGLDGALAHADLLLAIAERRRAVVFVPEPLVHSPGETGYSGEVLVASHPEMVRRLTRVGGRSEFTPRPGSMPWRIRQKFIADGLSDWRDAIHHPMESLARLLPQRFKGPRWRARGLPVRASAWDATPILRERPRGLALRDCPAPGEVDGKTRILLMHPHLIAGGAETVLLNLLAGLDRDRFSVTLVTTETWDSPKVLNAWRDRFERHVDGIFHLPSFLTDGYRLRFLLDLIEGHGIDVILISLSIFGYTALPHIRERFPHLAVADLLHAEAPYEPMDHIRLAARYRNLLTRRVVASEAMARVQLEKYGETAQRVELIPNGIDVAEEFAPGVCRAGLLRDSLGLDPDRQIILFVGRLSAEKQVDHILETAARLLGREDIAFVICGAGPEEAHLAQRVGTERLDNVFLGSPVPDVRCALADATAAMFPSKREGLPMSGIEALAMGVPLIVSDVPGWHELVEDGEDGILVPDGDIGGYVSAVLRLVDDPAERARLSANSRHKAVSQFDLDAVVRHWEQFFESLAEVGHP